MQINTSKEKINKKNINTPLISVIIPTYNRAELLKETLTSILNQSYKKMEILVLSDASTDNTEEIVNAFEDDRICYYRFPKNQGLPSKVRNEGLRRAKGEFIALCDDDDLWKPNKIKQQLAIFQKHPQLLVTSTRPKYLSKSFSLFRAKDIFFKSCTLSYDQLLSQNIINNSSVLMRRSVVKSIGLFDESPTLKAMEDYEYWLRILNFKDNSIYRDKKKLTIYRIHEAGISNLDLRNGITKSEQLEILFNKFPPRTTAKAIELQKRIQQVAHIDKVIDRFYKKNISCYTYIMDKEISISMKIKLLLNEILRDFLLYDYRNLK